MLVVFFTIKKKFGRTEINLQTKIRILEGTVMKVVKYGSETWVLQKADEDLLDVFQINCLWNVLGTRLTNRISNSRLYKKKFNPVFPGYNIREVDMARTNSADDRLPKIVLFGQPSWGKQKPGCLLLGWEQI